MNVLLSAAFVVCWSSGFVGARLGTEDAGATTLLMWRFLPLAAVLLAYALHRGRAPWRALAPRDLARQALIGLLSQSGYLLTVYYAIQLGVSSGTTALIDGTQPLVAGALAGPLLRQYVSARQWLGLCLGLCGVALVTTADAASTTGVAWWTYLVPFAGMLSLVAATFLDRRSRTPVTPADAMTVHCATSAVVFTAAALATGTATPPATGSFWLATVWLVTLSTFGGYGLYWLVLQRSGVTEVNTLMFLMAPVTAVWGALMFDEPFTPQTALGLAVALTAVTVVRGTGPRREEAEPAGSRWRRSGPGPEGAHRGRRRNSGRRAKTSRSRPRRAAPRPAVERTTAGVLRQTRDRVAVVLPAAHSASRFLRMTRTARRRPRSKSPRAAPARPPTLTACSVPTSLPSCRSRRRRSRSRRADRCRSPKPRGECPGVLSFPSVPRPPPRGRSPWTTTCTTTVGSAVSSVCSTPIR